MKFTIVTILPELFESALAAGVVGRARAAGTLTVDFVNPRDFTVDRHRSVDDTPYGGGPGMVMKCEPLVAAIDHASGHAVADPDVADPDGERAVRESDKPRAHRILLSPVGAPLTQARVRALAELPHLVLVCGRYEGVDQRVVDTVIDEELSLGDYVLSGGEIGALTIVDAVARYIPGVLGEPLSAEDESFSAGLLEYPQYTRPTVFRGLPIPEVLTTGNHEAIRKWRRSQSLRRTARRRPDLLATRPFSREDTKLAASIDELGIANRSYVALVHHPVLDRTGKVVTSALTNLDVHDISRSSATYGLGGYFIVTPVTSQRAKADHIAEVWREDGGEHRADALRLARPVATIVEAITTLTADHGQRPLVVATSASLDRFVDVPRRGPRQLVDEMVANPTRPVLLLFGTGWGLADTLVPDVDRLLTPIAGRPAWNHLSVRSAVVVLDRLFGLRNL